MLWWDVVLRAFVTVVSWPRFARNSARPTTPNRSGTGVNRTISIPTAGASKKRRTGVPATGVDLVCAGADLVRGSVVMHRPPQRDNIKILDLPVNLGDSTQEVKSSETNSSQNNQAT